MYLQMIFQQRLPLRVLLLQTFFSAIIGIAQLSFAIIYIIWLAKKSSGDAVSVAGLFKILITNVAILFILVIVFLIINIAYNQYLAKTL